MTEFMACLSIVFLILDIVIILFIPLVYIFILGGVCVSAFVIANGTKNNANDMLVIYRIRLKLKLVFCGVGVTASV
ncbi:hypothetical protein TUM3811_03660 [Shewanella algae]|nr:hypothetical protein TUM3811_03660 [Shewanella algae]